MYKVFESIHMLWISTWIHHHTYFTIFVRFEFSELAKLLGDSWGVLTEIFKFMLWLITDYKDRNPVTNIALQGCGGVVMTPSMS